MKKTIAITFDDGPDTVYTPKILDILKKENVKATFFLIGNKIKKNPKIAQRIFQEGHCIGNHTYTHLDMKDVSIERVEKEVVKTELLIDSMFGSSLKYMRAPWGAINDDQKAALVKLGYKVFKWNLDAFDWDINKNTVDGIVKRVLTMAKPGTILILHCADWTGKESREKTVEALPLIIDGLRKRQYEFVTLKQMVDGYKK